MTTKNEWAIEQTRYFYGPRKAVTIYLWPMSDEPLTGTRADMLNAIRMHERAIYYTAHNESSRPSFRVVKVGGRAYNAVCKRMGIVG